MTFSKASLLALAFSFASSVLALPSPSPVENTPSRTLNKRVETCTPFNGGSSSVDDTPAIEFSISQCGDGGIIVIPAGYTFYLNTALTFAGCVGCDFQIEGTIMASDDTSYWSTQTNIISVDSITGAQIHSVTGTGVINGNGQAAWDAFAADAIARPTLFSVEGTSSNIQVYDLTVQNPPNVFFTVSSGSTSIHYSGLTMTAVSTSSNPAANTDGFDINGSTVSVTDTKITNDDDCIAFKPGANLVTVSGITCTGSHGISIGSLGSSAGVTDTVKNIYVSDVIMVSSTKAAGIKLYPGGDAYGSALVSNVTFTDFTVDASGYAFQIQSCYNQDAAYCAEYPSTAKLEGIYVENFSGTTSTKYEPDVANINCPADGLCDVYFSGMSVNSPEGTGVYLCADSSTVTGITCVAGASG
ncbi:glycoside hydrolase family 28 protein [Hyaloscypha variabilis F]|uniref:Glycoside hydrolase family 28 protein n=1 Tax=Hyaloscypha variabilis (strain UAMH 11265 / GT02V1 / F) TaxID=1149755 RepID=A0A2J6QUQ3_HYAVF|nr:glycoside hydrolase family 28 protein [Hyaloscypha variabilis F]